MTHYLKRSLLVALFFLSGHFGLLNRATAEPLVLPVAQNSDASSQQTLLRDNLASASWWQNKVKAQAELNQGQQYQGCLFGDSITSGLGNTLGKNTFNFAIGGLSSVSLIEQLKILKLANIKCRKAIIAIGTNDAWYVISDDVFFRNLRQAISLLRDMGASQITLIPAFYSTIAASHNPTLAGPIQRVEEINVLIHQVALIENVLISTTGLRPLFSNHSLKKTLTVDGVHLNNSGKKIYREVLLKILKPSKRSHYKSGRARKYRAIR